MLINFSDKELAAIRQLALMLEVSEEKIVILALRYYQLKISGIAQPPSPGCGDLE